MPRQPLLSILTIGVILFSQTVHTHAETLTFPIKRFEVEGNTLLPIDRLQALTTPFTGDAKSFAEIQLAQESLERAYRSKGFSAVAITLPEQEIKDGVVIFKVIESRLGNITVKGARHFSEDNIRRSLPHIVRGEMPHAVAMTSEVSLANENPSKNVEIVLKISETPSEVDAEIKVDDARPTRFIASMDNTGMGSTVGNYRMGIAWQHTNLFDRDHVLTMQYTTSPDYLNEVQLFNMAYHIPYYSTGDSLDLYTGYSSVDAGSFSGSGINGFVGKGAVAGLRYNHHLQRAGEYDHKLSLGWDWKAFQNDCSGFACATVGSDVTSSPISLNYVGNWSRPGAQTLFSAGYSHNFPIGKNSSKASYAGALHSQPLFFGAERNFDIVRVGLSQLNLLPQGWQSRVSLNSQFTDAPLIQGEQFGITGANSVRGFNEREVSRDYGYVANFELFTPELASLLPGPDTNLRILLFYDHGHGKQVKTNVSGAASETVASAGVGLRFAYKQTTTLKLDFANVRDGAGIQEKGDWKVHLGLTSAF